MQQLNALPINTSKNVETKDDVNAFVSSSSKGGFSRHIDSHLAKSKDVSNNENMTVDESINTKIDEGFSESRSLKTDDKTQNRSDTSQALVDETNSANQAQKIAASGNENKKKSDEEHKIIDDPALLMSFLVQADKTLMDENSAERIKLGEMSAEQQAKYKAQLLLKSSDLVAELSDVAKAVNPTSEAALAGLAEQEKLANSLLASSKYSKTNTEINQLNTIALTESNTVESNSLAEKNLVNNSSVMTSKDKFSSKVLAESKLLDNRNLTNENIDKSSDNTKAHAVDSELSRSKNNTLSQQFNANQLDKKGLGNSTAVDKNAQQLLQNNIENEISSQMDEGSAKASQKELSQQSLSLENRNIDPSNIKISPKLSASIKAISNEKNPLDVESKFNDKIVKLVQGENGLTESEVNVASVVSASQNTNTSSNKNLSTVNLGQQTITEPVVKQGGEESKGKLSAKSVDYLIEQSNEFSADENKSASAKVLTKTNSDFSVNSNFRDAASRATQATYDRVDQQVAEIFNPTGSAEVSQSQKTNTQLHQETIAIFRRDFADAVKDKVMLMISQKLQQFDITLDPPELGNMQVRVNLQGEQAAVNFVVQNQQAKDALEQNMHKLRDLLAEQGVDVGDANVEQQSQQSENEANEEENMGRSHHNSLTNTADASDVIEHNLSARMLGSSLMGVDYYA